MGNAFIKAQKYEELFVQYENVVDRDKSAEIFPDEAVQNWYSWLQRQPNFPSADLGGATIKQVIQDCSRCKSHWMIFNGFLNDYYIPIISDPFATNWKNEKIRITEWLLTK
jgi:hypothetical protein